jgi:hypothetical protein
MTTRARTLRLPLGQAQGLEARRAIAAHMEARRQDADFQKRLQHSVDRNKEILERLAG